ncbi:MAG: response regulator [Polyangiaceae bacterium]|nr:response regulator [Polyangiaceae bacterium]
MTAQLDDRLTVLVVDDDDVLRAVLVRAFDARGFSASGAKDTESALALAKDEPPEYAVVDLRLGGESGLALVAALLREEPETRVVVLTGYGSIATAVEATKLGAVNYLTKPADVDDILRALQGDASLGVDAEAEVPSLARIEWEHIHRVLADVGGNVSEAARRLKIHRRSLQRKLSKHAPP